MIYIEFFGIVSMFSNDVIVEIDGTKDFGNLTTLSIVEYQSVYSTNLVAAFAMFNITANEVNPSTGTNSVSLNFRKVFNFGVINFSSATKYVITAAENCGLVAVTGAWVDLRSIRTSMIKGTCTILRAWIENCGTTTNHPSNAADITASQSLYVVNTHNISGLTLTSPDVKIDRFSYDAGIADGSLTIGTPGSVTMIDPPEVVAELYVDINYTGDYKNGSNAYPYTAIQDALDVIGIPVDEDDAKIYFSVYIGSGYYYEDLLFPPSRRITLHIADTVYLKSGGGASGNITIACDGNLEWGGYVAYISIFHGASISAGKGFVMSGGIDAAPVNSPTSKFGLILGGVTVPQGIDFSNLTTLTSPVELDFDRSLIYTEINALTTAYLRQTERCSLLGNMSVKNINFVRFCSFGYGVITLNEAPSAANIGFEICTFYSPTTITAPTAAFRCDSDTYASLINTTPTITNSDCFDVTDTIVPDDERYVSANATYFEDGSEEYPFSTPALARADDANAVIKLVGHIENPDVDIGTEIIDEFPDTVGRAVTWKIVITKGPHISCVTAKTVWDSSTEVIAALVEDTVVYIGVLPSTHITLSCDLVANQVRLKATTISDNWSVKIIERIIV
jgi:hypothetical protein